MGKKLKFLWNHQTEYKHDDLNKIGATTDLTLRTITAPAAGTTNYVRKFGKQLSITGCTAIDNPTANMTIKVYALDDTLLGSRVNGGAFVAGSACTAQGVYIEVSAAGGAGTLAVTESITLTGLGALVVNFPAETIADGASMDFYLAESGSTYYDSGMMYGGARHTPVLGSEQYAYFHPVAADTALAGGRTIVHVLDSCYYQIDEDTIMVNTTKWQAALGETSHLPTIIGVSEYRDVEHDGNNTDTAYVCKTGNDGAATGTYQDPYLTHSHAFTNRGARTYINTMDSGTYNESFTISANITFEPCYGKVPIITYGSAVTANFTLTATTINIYGYEFDGKNLISYGIYQNNAALDFLGNIKYYKSNNYINDGFKFECNSFNGNLKNNLIINNGNKGINVRSNNTSNGKINKNILYNNVGNQGIYYIIAGAISSVEIKNNYVFNNQGGITVAILGGSTYNGTVENNTVCNAVTYGLYFENFGTLNSVCRNNILWNNIILDIYSSSAITITYTNYLTKNVNVTAGAGCITTDPKFCKTTLPYKLGIAAHSGAYHTDSNNNNMGCIPHGLNIQADDVTINGFIFDGLDSYVHGLIITSNTDYTGLDLKWNDFKNFQGIAVDLWDDGTNLDADMLNCKFNNSGQGLALAYGGNTITECLFYKNSKINIWVNRLGHTINHCVIYNAEYGIYIDSNGGGIIVKNSIIAQNSIYGIYSEIAMSITYCCIRDAVTSNVDATDSNNIIDDPLFVNTTAGSEDFHIKTKESGTKIESPCREAADDGYDMGAWLIDYGIIEDSWMKYTVEFNPRNMDELYKRKGGKAFEDGQGDYSGWSKSRRIRLPMVWAGNSATSKTQRLQLRHFSEREMSREMEYTEAGCEFLISLIYDTYYGDGTATIDATAKTLTDNTKTWIFNEIKGWYCTVIYTDGVGIVVDASAKTATKAGAGWTIDEWIGYYFPYDGYYWYIKSNTATVLTLSDPNGDLVDHGGIDYNITKQFKIMSNLKTVLTLRDSNSELISGSYDYYIDYIACNVIGSDFGYKQAVYDYEKDKTKSGYALTFEEID